MMKQASVVDRIWLLKNAMPSSRMNLISNPKQNKPPCVAIIAFPDMLPVIVQAESEALLCGDILALAHTPADIETMAGIRTWLASLPRPSGIYSTMVDAKAAVQAVIEEE